MSPLRQIKQFQLMSYDPEMLANDSNLFTSVRAAPNGVLVS